ncbi:hypothetical protein IW261DRAFT_1426394 [Armillaria novae-zelandiae]|uniref:Uncharacterized protein n=1 Tax=Armillaria novae-zelandiae TaxID=153914 RepID=A0AA39TR64_9AGAR|nr:hypothetical protein IW261DRAFT_1426394 [Armillaria novae-zelandiae]
MAAMQTICTAIAAFLPYSQVNSLFGISNLQAIVYYKNYPNDWWVASLWIFDAVHAALSTHALYYYLINLFGKFTGIYNIVWVRAITSDDLDLSKCDAFTPGVINGLLGPIVFVTVSPTRLSDAVETALDDTARPGVIGQLMVPKTVDAVAIVQTLAATTGIDDAPRPILLRVVRAQSNLRVFTSMVSSAFMVVVVVFQQALWSLYRLFFRSIPIPTSRPWHSSFLRARAQVSVFTMMMIVLISVATDFLARSVSFEKRFYFGTMVPVGEVIIEDIPSSELSDNLEASVDTASLLSGNVCTDAAQTSRASVSIQATLEVHEVNFPQFGTKQIPQKRIDNEKKKSKNERKENSRQSAVLSLIEASRPAQPTLAKVIQTTMRLLPPTINDTSEVSLAAEHISEILSVAAGSNSHERTSFVIRDFTTFMAQAHDLYERIRLDLFPRYSQFLGLNNSFTVNALIGICNSLIPERFDTTFSEEMGASTWNITAPADATQLTQCSMKGRRSYLTLFKSSFGLQRSEVLGDSIDIGVGIFDQGYQLRLPEEMHHAPLENEGNTPMRSERQEWRGQIHADSHLEAADDRTVRLAKRSSVVFFYVLGRDEHMNDG